MAIVAASVVLAVALSGCLGPLEVLVQGSGPSNIPQQFDDSRVPASIRSDVASLFPEYKIVDAEIGSDDVIVTLSHRSRPLYMTEQWDRTSVAGSPKAAWLRTTRELGGFDLADKSDPRTRTFLDFFVGLHPDGEYILNGMTPELYPADYSDLAPREFEANLFPVRSTPDLFGSHTVAETERYIYDPKTSHWSRR